MGRIFEVLPFSRRVLEEKIEQLYSLDENRKNIGKPDMYCEIIWEDWICYRTKLINGKITYYLYGRICDNNAFNGNTWIDETFDWKIWDIKF